MTIGFEIIFLAVGAFVGAMTAWFAARVASRAELHAERLRGANLDADLRVAREQLNAERAERRSEATSGIQKIADDLAKHLDVVEKSIVELDKQRSAGDASLRSTLDTLQKSDQELRTALVATSTETAKLTTALRDNRVRGRWGELSLRRIVELAGMIEHCDFDEQPVIDGKRPDAVIHLPDGMEVPIDAKAPLNDYLAALEAQDPAEVTRLLQANAAALRLKVREVARREYGLASKARFAIVYVPLESVLSAALSVDPEILEDALQQGIHIASPMTLVAALRAFAYGWALHKQQLNAEAILEESHKLVERLGVFGRAFAGVGNALETTVRRWNEAVGSFDGRLSVTAREIAGLSGRKIEQPEPSVIETAVRPVVKIEMLELGFEQTPPIEA